MRRWRNAHHSLERTAEGRFGSIAGLCRDGRDVGAAAGQKARGNLHPPFGEIMHWRNADELCKSFGQNRA